jgi:hypothetical protein
VALMLVAIGFKEQGLAVVALRRRRDQFTRRTWGRRGPA